MALDVMEEEDFDAQTVRKTHALATRSANRLTELTNGLLELVLIEDRAQVFALRDLGPIIEGARDMLQAQIAEGGATVEFGQMPSPPVNEGLMLRVFLNLIGNAIKYRAPDRPPEVRIHVMQESADLVELAVSDNGRGIPTDCAWKIFAPLQRLHSHDEIEGAGLGLTICERIMALHGGTIALDTTYDAGARFLLRLYKNDRPALP
jgi:light-regulated signal transduction histidine kinase (bacteriophytochrome)